MRIDTHVHFWEPERFHYPWMAKAPVLNQPFMPVSLLPEMAAAGIDACVLMAATEDIAETHWLLDLADQHAAIRTVIGGVDFGSATDLQRIAALAQHPRLAGFRLNYVAKIDDPVHWDRGLALLHEHGLLCDVLCRFHLVDDVVALVRRWPDVAFVVDHFAGAPLHADPLDYRQAVSALAALPNVTLKLANYHQAADPYPLTQTVLATYVATSLDGFGADRLMYASNWPIHRLVEEETITYADIVAALDDILVTYDAATQRAIWGETAARVYHIGQEAEGVAS